MSTTGTTTSTTTGTTTSTGRHPVAIAHLVMGVAFAGLVVVWALITTDVVEGDHVRWLLPVPWVLAGAAGLVGLVASDRRQRRQQVGWVVEQGPGTMRE
jgi:hypothetical protein